MLLTDDDFISKPAAAKKAAAVKPTVLSETDFLGTPPKESWWQETKNVAKDVASYAAGTVGQIVDMGISVGNVFSIPGQDVAGGRAIEAQRKATGKTPPMLESWKTYEGAAAAYKEGFLPPWLANPFKRIAEALGPESKSYYDENGIGWVMKHFSEGTEKGSKAIEEKTGIPAEATSRLVGTLMDFYGAKGVAHSIGRSVQGRMRAEEVKQGKIFDKRQAPLEPTEPVMEYPPEGPAPKPVSQAEFDKQQRKVQNKFTTQIETGIKELEPPDIAKLIKQAKSPQAAVESLFERAARQGLEERLAREELTKTRAANAEPMREAASVPESPRTFIDEMIAKEPAKRTQTEKDILEAWRRGGMDAQAGKVSKDLIQAMAILGVTAGGLAYIKAEHPEILFNIGKKLHEWTNSDKWKEYKREQEQQEIERSWDKQNEHTPLTTPEGTGLAAEDFLGPLGVGMAVKGKGGMWHPEAVARLARPLQDKLSGAVQRFGVGLDAVLNSEEFAKDPNKAHVVR